MDVTELKFLLKLLGFTDYRALITKVEPNPKTKASERDRIGRQLIERGLVDCTEEIKKLAIAPPGKSLLQADPTTLPISEQELKVLKATAKGSISPAQTGVAAEQRQAVIHSLAARGFIKVIDKKFKEVWLTERGKEFLRDEFESNSTKGTIHLKMLTEYLRFLRKVHLPEKAALPPTSPAPETAAPVPMKKPSDEEIWQLIRALDQELVTDNYLPIFHLRQKLQPPLSRRELDQALYRLEGDDKIELSSLVDTNPYSPDQINAGIPQDLGCPLFFITYF
ncbi:hypothetical protein [Laspinema olomoucense]|uniref:Uncharacterized protein n=1 Tax=Laspinema olomoucense D3b TaxID=2953688 RepID=A0ABT2N9U6_9CYAN|nr:MULTISPECIES: hypothetical protein [unclassified Laspinema]MCT7971407.1 hypothetical protein [Laspinema sp. D3d]MCT7979474.1 hypothetical protein [Laspinema sp. D3b]MCT7987278.1 hypothetical protein [Laspinema sp. D3a]